MSFSSKEIFRACCPPTMDALEIIGNKKSYSIQPIIYFLLSGDEIVYVGQSKHGISRIYKHVTDKTKSFTHYFYHSCPVEYLNYLEKLYIKKFTPKYNLVHNDNKFPERKFTINEEGKRIFRIKHNKSFVKWSGKDKKRWSAAYG